MLRLIYIRRFNAYFVSHKDPSFLKMYFIAVSVLVYVIGFVFGLLALTNLLTITIFIVSYFHFCFMWKKRIRSKSYIVLFLCASTFFVIWVTVVFGKYYFENELVDVSNLLLQYDAIMDENNWLIIEIFKSSVFYFNISFGNYFTLPDELSLGNPFVVQFIFGIVISGTIFSWIFDTIRHFIAPSESN